MNKIIKKTLLGVLAVCMVAPQPVRSELSPTEVGSVRAWRGIVYGWLMIAATAHMCWDIYYKDMKKWKVLSAKKKQQYLENQLSEIDKEFYKRKELLAIVNGAINPRGWSLNDWLYQDMDSCFEQFQQELTKEYRSTDSPFITINGYNYWGISPECVAHMKVIEAMYKKSRTEKLTAIECTLTDLSFLKANQLLDAGWADAKRWHEVR